MGAEDRDGRPLRIAVAGVGNCASCLIQGLEFYKEHTLEPVGLIREKIGPWGPGDLELSAAFDVSTRKVGLDASEAIFAEPNNAERFAEVPNLGVTVAAAPPLDGVGELAAQRIEVTPAVASVVDHLKENLQQSGTDVLVNFLPVGSQLASEFYAAAALDAGCGFVNAIPTVIARSPEWAEQFEEKNLPLVGDDVKSQVGATISHRALVETYSRRGVVLDRTYQLNVGGNMDFFNMKQTDRLGDKKVSKRQSINDVANRGAGLKEEDLHVGPSDFVPFLEDTKLAFIRLEGRGFGGNPTVIEARFEAHDSQNSAGVVFDAVRYAGLARLAGTGGVLNPACSWLMKAPPRAATDEEAERAVDDWESLVSAGVKDRSSVG